MPQRFHIGDERGYDIELPDDWSREEAVNYIKETYTPEKYRQDRKFLAESELERLQGETKESQQGWSFLHSVGRLTNAILGSGGVTGVIGGGARLAGSPVAQQLASSPTTPLGPMLALSKPARKWVGNMLDLEAGKDPYDALADKLAFYGHSIDQATRFKQREDMSGAERFFTEDLENVIGSGLVFLGGGVALRGITTATGAAATLGALSGYESGYSRAIANGSDTDTAHFLGILNAGVGTTEALPAGKWINRLTMKRGLHLGDIIKETGEEAAQEAFQSLTGDLFGKYIGKEDLEAGQIFGNVVHGAFLGAVGGALFSGGTQLYSAKRSGQTIMDVVRENIPARQAFGRGPESREYKVLKDAFDRLDDALAEGRIGRAEYNYKRADLNRRASMIADAADRQRELEENTKRQVDEAKIQRKKEEAEKAEQAEQDKLDAQIDESQLSPVERKLKRITLTENEENVLDLIEQSDGRDSVRYRKTLDSFIAERDRQESARSLARQRKEQAESVSDPAPEAVRSVTTALAHLGMTSSDEKVSRDITWDQTVRLARASIEALSPQSQQDREILDAYKARMNSALASEQGVASVETGSGVNQNVLRNAERRLWSNHEAKSYLKALLIYHDSAERSGRKDEADYMKRQIASIFGLNLVNGSGKFPTAYKVSRVDDLIGKQGAVREDLVQGYPIGTPVTVTDPSTGIETTQGVVVGYTDDALRGSDLVVSTAQGVTRKLDAASVAIQSSAPRVQAPQPPKPRIALPSETVVQMQDQEYDLTYDEYTDQTPPVVVSIDPTRTLHSQNLRESQISNSQYDAILQSLGLGVGVDRVDMSDKLREVRSSSYILTISDSTASVNYPEAQIDEWLDFWGVAPSLAATESEARSIVRKNIASLTDGKRGTEPQLDMMASELGLKDWNVSLSKSKKVNALRAAINKSDIGRVTRAASNVGIQLVSKKMSKADKIKLLRNTIQDRVGNYKGNAMLYGARQAYIGELFDAAYSGRPVSSRAIESVRSFNPGIAANIEQAIIDSRSLAGTYPVSLAVQRKYQPVQSVGVSKDAQTGEVIPVTLVGYGETEAGTVGAMIMPIGNWRLPDGTPFLTGRVIPYTAELNEVMQRNGITLEAAQFDAKALDENTEYEARLDYRIRTAKDAKAGPELSGPPFPRAAIPSVRRNPKYKPSVRASEPVSSTDVLQAADPVIEASQQEDPGTLPPEVTQPAEEVAPVQAEEPTAEVVEFPPPVIEQSPEPLEVVSLTDEQQKQLDERTRLYEKLDDELMEWRANYPDASPATLKRFANKLHKSGFIDSADLDEFNRILSDKTLDKDDRKIDALDSLLLIDPQTDVRQEVTMSYGRFDVRRGGETDIPVVVLKDRIDAGVFRVVGVAVKDSSRNVTLSNLLTGVEATYRPDQIVSLDMARDEIDGGPDRWVNAIANRNLTPEQRLHLNALQSPLNVTIDDVIDNYDSATIRQMADRESYGNIALLGARIGRSFEDPDDIALAAEEAAKAKSEGNRDMQELLGGIYAGALGQTRKGMAKSASGIASTIRKSGQFSPVVSPSKVVISDALVRQELPPVEQSGEEFVAQSERVAQARRIEASRNPIDSVDVQSVIAYDTGQLVEFARRYGSGDMFAAAYRMGRNLDSAIPFRALENEKSALRVKAQGSKLAELLGEDYVGALTNSKNLINAMNRLGDAGLSEADSAWIRLNGFVLPALEAATGKSQNSGVASRVELYQDESYEPPIVCTSPCKRGNKADTVGTPSSREGRTSDSPISNTDEMIARVAAISTARPKKSQSFKKMLEGSAMMRDPEFARAIREATYIPTSQKQRQQVSKEIVDFYDDGTVAAYSDIIGLINMVQRDDKTAAFHGIADNVKLHVVYEATTRLSRIRSRTKVAEIRDDITAAIAGAYDYNRKAATMAGQALEEVGALQRAMPADFFVESLIRKLYEDKGLVHLFNKNRAKFNAYKDRLIALQEAGSTGIPTQIVHNEIIDEVRKDIKVTPQDIYWSFWYNNILSSTMTMTDNLTMITNGAVEGVMMTLTDPKQGHRALWNYVRGIVVGIKELKLGIQGKNYKTGFYDAASKTRDDINRTNNTLDLREDVLRTIKDSDNLFAKIIASTRHIGYIMQTSDYTIARGGFESRARFHAYQMARANLEKKANDAAIRKHGPSSLREGNLSEDLLPDSAIMAAIDPDHAWHLTEEEAAGYGPVDAEEGLHPLIILPTQAEIDAEIDRILRTTDEDIANYKERVDQEIRDGVLPEEQRNARLDEMIQLGYPSEIQEDAAEYMRRITGNTKEPYGVLGAMHKFISKIKEDEGAVGFAAKKVFPFTRWVANWGNIILDYMPGVAFYRMMAWSPNVGKGVSELTDDGTKSKLAKWIQGQGKVVKAPKNLTPTDIAMLRVKGIFSLIGAMSAWALFSAFDDDEDPALQITGSMKNMSRQRRESLDAAGIKPYSIKIGSVSLSYKSLPFAAMLGAIGSIKDMDRYGVENERTAFDTAFQFFTSGAMVISEMSVLSSFNSFVRSFNTNASIEKQQANLVTWLGRVALPAVVPFSNLQRDIENWTRDMFDKPTLFVGTDPTEKFLRDWPIVGAFSQGENAKPLLNQLGEPVDYSRAPWARQAWQAKDDIWKTISLKIQDDVLLPNITRATYYDDSERKRVPMNEEQLYEFKSIVYKTLGDELKRNHEWFKNASPEASRRYISQISRRAQLSARRELGLPQ